MKRTRLLLLVVFLAFCLLSCSKTYYAWNSIGPIQVLGNDDELWIFLEIDRQVRHSGGGFDSPRVYPVGHSQELIIIGRQGLKRRTPIKMQDSKCGPSVHPNLSRIFAMDGAIYMFSGPSAQYRASLYKWQNDHFKILSIDESDSFYRQYNPTYFTGQRSESLDKLTESAGWFHLYSGRSFSGAMFDWSGISTTLAFSGENEKEFEVDILMTQNDTSAASYKLTYDREQKKLNHSEYMVMPREDHGHPK